MPPRKTKAGKLSDVARHVIVPAGVTSTGWPAVRDTCAGFGVTFDPWQDGAGRLILAKRADGSYAASIGGVVISIPRQVGKTFLLGAIVFALCLLNPGLTVLWTAHRMRTANETFTKMQAFARRQKVKPHVAKVVLGSGEEEVVFRNGARILFGARERGFGRGFDDVDIEIFDEAQILTENAVDDMIPAMNTAANPLPIFIGTPPKPTDPSEVFTAKRAAALEGDKDTAYIEGSADEDCDPNDHKQWRKANFSFPRRTPVASMLRMQKNLTPESFLREGLGVWPATGASAVVDLEAWAALEDLEDTDDQAKRPNPVAFAVEVSPDRKWSTIGVAGVRSDGELHVQIIQSGRGTAWVPDRLAELAKEWKPVGVGLNGTGPAKSLIPKIRAKKLRRFTVLKSGDMAAGCGMVVDGITEGTIHHDGGVLITRSLEVARKRRVGEVWVWAPPIGEPVDISPLNCMTAALFVLAKYPKRTGTGRSNSGRRRATVLS